MGSETMGSVELHFFDLCEVGRRIQKRQLSSVEVTRALIGNFVKSGDGYQLEFSFQLEAGEARLPKAPITEKVSA